MAEFPAIPLWTDAYLADTTHLTTLEHGAYMLLLFAAWRSPDCSLPDDDKILAKFARLGPRQWTRIRVTILAFFDHENGRLVQRRLKRERIVVKQQRERAASAANARWLKNNDTDYAPASTKHSSSIAPTPTPTPTPNKASELGDRTGPARPVEVIRIFDEIQNEIYNGQRRAFPAGDDIVFATRWLTAGASLEQLSTLFRSRLTSRKNRGERTIGSLKFLDTAVNEMISRPEIAERKTRPSRPARQDARDAMEEIRKQFASVFPDEPNGGKDGT